MPEVTLAGHIVIPMEDLASVQAELKNHIRLTRDEPGCLEFNVTQDEVTPTIYHVSERFESPEAFSQHQARVRTSHWGSITKNVKRHYKITGLDSN